MKNAILILIGWSLIIPAIILGPIIKCIPSKMDLDRPWVDGLFINLMRAYRKYDYTSWRRRMITIWHNPSLTLEYIHILLNKQTISFIGYKEIAVSNLSCIHAVQIDHQHHLDRVKDLRANKTISSSYGDIVVVNDLVHDGNHRITAMKEAGNKSVMVKYYK